MSRPVSQPQPRAVAEPCDNAPARSSIARLALRFMRGEAGAISAEWIILSGLMFAFVGVAIAALSAAIAAKDVTL